MTEPQIDGWVIHDNGVSIFAQGKSYWFSKELILTFYLHIKNEHKEWYELDSEFTTNHKTEEVNK